MIVTVIRLGLIMSGSMDAREKITKIGYWIIGLIIVIISWNVLGQIWGVDTNGFKGHSVNEKTTTDYDDKNSNVNNGTYYGTKHEDQTEDVPIKIESNK
jgi:hypothetical protein